MRKDLKLLILLAIAVATGCQSGPEEPIDSTAELASTRSATDEYGLEWMKSDDSTVIRVDMYIDAPIDVVWSLVRDPNGYASFNRALTAQIDRMEVGAPIALYIRMFGDQLPATQSDEIVEIFDEELHVASWMRDFGNGQSTHRPQLLEVEGAGTHYYTALKLPPSLAWLVGPLFGNHIKAAFERFAEGLRDESVRRAAAQP